VGDVQMGSAGKDQKREFKYYRLTPAGKKQLTTEESKWKQMTAAIARVIVAAGELNALVDRRSFSRPVAR